MHIIGHLANPLPLDGDCFSSAKSILLLGVFPTMRFYLYTESPDPKITFKLKNLSAIVGLGVKTIFTLHLARQTIIFAGFFANRDAVCRLPLLPTAWRPIWTCAWSIASTFASRLIHMTKLQSSTPSELYRRRPGG